MDLSDFQRKAILLIFISILVGAILLARKEPLKIQREKGVAEQSSAPTIQPTPIPTKIDINTADIAQIMQLPGIGPALAKEIIKYRPYSTIEDLLKVPMIGEKRLARIRDIIDLPEAKLIEVAPPSHTDVQKQDMSEVDEQRSSPPSYDSRIDPKVKCPQCDKQLWEKGKKRQRYIRCPQCLKLL